MISLVFLPLLAACAAGQIAPYYAHPYAGHLGYGAHPYTYGYVPSYHTSQYHAQDEFGQFSFGHSAPHQARSEVKTLDGVVRGAYSYLDANNKVNRVEYIADAGGFRVLGANNLPEAPVFDLEAPVFDLEAPVFDLEAPVHDAPIPVPVEDTAEVKAAKEEFQMLYDEAAAAAAAQPAERKKRQILYSTLHHPLSVAKATYKTHSFDTVEADTPADTQLAELTEKEHEVAIPYYIPHFYSYHHLPHHQLKLKEAERKKRETVALVGFHPVAYAKGTYKDQTFENVEGAEAPADTARADFMTHEHEYTYPVHTPYIYPYISRLFW